MQQMGFQSISFPKLNNFECVQHLTKTGSCLMALIHRNFTMESLILAQDER